MLQSSDHAGTFGIPTFAPPYSEGPIEDPDRVQDAVRRAADVVASTGQPALVDVVCQYR